MIDFNNRYANTFHYAKHDMLYPRFCRYVYDWMRLHELDFMYYHGTKHIPHNVDYSKGIRIVVPVSGGLDSYIALKMIQYITNFYGNMGKPSGRNIDPLSQEYDEECNGNTLTFNPYISVSKIEIIPVRISYGQTYDEREQRAIQRLGIDLDPNYLELNLDYYQKAQHLVPSLGLDNTNIYARNQAIVSICSMLNPDVILTGTLADEMYHTIKDSSNEFLEKMSDVSSTVLGKRCVVSTLFAGMTKSDIVAIATYVLNVDNLLDTYSCNHPSDHQCGRCISCFKRYVAFKNNKIETSDMYVSHPMDSLNIYTAKRKTAIGYQEVLNVIKWSKE